MFKMGRATLKNLIRGLKNINKLLKKKDNSICKYYSVFDHSRRST